MSRRSDPRSGGRGGGVEVGWGGRKGEDGGGGDGGKGGSGR